MGKKITTPLKSKTKSKVHQSSNNNKKVDTNTAATVEEEEDSTSSIYDSILSTCGCYAGETGNNKQRNSVIDRAVGCGNISPCIEHQPVPRQQQRQTNQQANANNNNDDDDIENEPTRLWDRLSDMALYLIGATPPVKFVKCFECSSVDESEVTMPRALSELAEDYDYSRTNNAVGHWRGTGVSGTSMWSVSEDTTADGYTDEELDEIGRRIDMIPLGLGGNPQDDFVTDGITQRVPLRRSMKRSGLSGRWDRLKLTRSTSGSRGGNSRSSRASRSGLLRSNSSHTESYLNKSSSSLRTASSWAAIAGGHPAKSTSSRRVSRGGRSRSSRRGGGSSMRVEI